MLKYHGSGFGCAEFDLALINSRPTDVESVVLTALMLVLVLVLVLVLTLEPIVLGGPTSAERATHAGKALSRENRQVRGYSQVSPRAYGRL
jgi:hypothetical protein